MRQDELSIHFSPGMAKNMALVMEVTALLELDSIKIRGESAHSYMMVTWYVENLKQFDASATHLNERGLPWRIRVGDPAGRSWSYFRFDHREIRVHVEEWLKARPLDLGVATVEVFIRG